MNLNKYSSETQRLTIEEFLELPQDKAIQYDFLRQGDEPDRSSLINEIYHLIFPWYDETKHAGDTLNTYRLAVMKYYGKSYRFLDRATQLKIIDIIATYTPHNENYLFEFEEIDKNGNKYYQLCNNYQLGNFGILPKRYGINPKRAQKPYSDFLDEFVLVIFDFFTNQDFLADDSLKKSVQMQEEYFNNFSDFKNFVDSNFLLDSLLTLTEEGSEEYEIYRLSTSKSFEEYVKVATRIIEVRGSLIWKFLHPNDSDLEVSVSSYDYESRLEQIKLSFEQQYSVDADTALNIAKMQLLREYLNDEKSIIQQRDTDLSTNSAQLARVIDIEEHKSISKERSWKKWLSWIALGILGITLYRAKNYHATHYENVNHLLIATKHWVTVYYLYNFLVWVFWIVVILALIYHHILTKKEQHRYQLFQEEKQDKINDLQKNFENEQEKIRNYYNRSLKTHEQKNNEILNFRNIMPPEYANSSSISAIIELILRGRADNIKESYAVMDNLIHQRNMESAANQSAYYARQRAESQERQEIEAREAADRQERLAREAADEQREHFDRQERLAREAAKNR